MSKSMARSQNRIPELDGIRGLAILLVVAYHYIAVPISASATAGFLIVRQTLSNGWSGVDLFFVLSGFLICGILIDHRTSEDYFKVFYVRRVTRIFPLYYLFLALFLLLQRLSPSSGIFSQGLFSNALPLLPYVVYLQNFAMAARGTFGNEFLAVTWSLAVEEHFYLLLPAIVRRTLPQRLPLILGFFICLTLILRFMLGGEKFYSFVATPWRLDALFLGALLAVLFRSPGALEAFKARVAWIKLGFGILVAFFIYSTVTEPLGSLDHLFTFGLMYAALIFLTLANQGGLLARFFRLSWLRNIGRISYGIYIFHQLVNGTIQDLVFKQVPSFHDGPTILVTLLAFVATYLLATGTYRAFESRLIAFGHTFRYSQD
jgi:peptidoglycan/LPS O-acetylase OafA/YrhL